MSYRFADVRVIDGVAASALDHRDVVVDGGRIVAVAAAVPREALPGEMVIDGGGRTLLPGLIDAHAHYTLDPIEGSLPAIARRSDAEIVLMAAGHAARALRAGITTARGAGSIRNLECVLRDAIAPGHVPGPRLLVAGLAVGIICGHGYHALRALYAAADPGPTLPRRRARQPPATASGAGPGP